MKFRFNSIIFRDEFWWALEGRPHVRLCHKGMVALFPHIIGAGALRVELTRKSVKGSCRMLLQPSVCGVQLRGGNWADLTINATNWLADVLGEDRDEVWYVKVTPI